MEKVKCMQCGNDNPATSKYCSRCGYELPKAKAETAENPAPAVTPASPVNNRKKIIGIITTVVTFFVVYYAVQAIFFKSPSFDEATVAMMNEINKNCPVMVDESTQLDNVAALPGNMLQYNYTLVGIEKSQVNTDEVKQVLEPKIINAVKENPDLKQIREHKTTLVYNYKDKNAAFLLKITVTPAMYE